MNTRTVTEHGQCHDCAWNDDRIGARGRAARHHNTTGHQVSHSKHVLITRAGPPPGQTELAGLEPAPRPPLTHRTRTR